MLISQTAEYALRAIVYMAEHGGAPRITQEIATATRVPPGYLSKVLQSLCRAGLLTSQRGLGGGFAIAKNLSEISIYSVVQAVDPIQRITACPLGKVHSGTVLCPLHKRLDDAIASVEKTFKETSVADMLNERGRQGALCAHPFITGQDHCPCEHPQSDAAPCTCDADKHSPDASSPKNPKTTSKSISFRSPSK